jgi:hypothetical protein
LPPSHRRRRSSPTAGWHMPVRVSRRGLFERAARCGGHRGEERHLRAIGGGVLVGEGAEDPETRGSCDPRSGQNELAQIAGGGKFVVGFEGAHTVENLAQDTSAETFVQATDAALGDDFTGHRDWVGPDAAELDAHLDLPLAPRELRNRARAGQRSVSRHKFRRATAPCPSAG